MIEKPFCSIVLTKVVVKNAIFLLWRREEVIFRNLKYGRIHFNQKHTQPFVFSTGLKKPFILTKKANRLYEQVAYGLVCNSVVEGL